MKKGVFTMEHQDISRRTLLKDGGAALAGLTVLRVAGPAQAFGQDRRGGRPLAGPARAEPHPGERRRPAEVGGPRLLADTRTTSSSSTTTVNQTALMRQRGGRHRGPGRPSPIPDAG